MPANHIFSANGESFYLFSMTDSKWTLSKIGYNSWLPFFNETNALYVYARGVLYWFTTGICHIYTLKDRSYHVLSTTHDAYKAACYNGNDQIYVVEVKTSNEHDNSSTYQVHSFNIDTLKFEAIGNPFDFKYASPFTFAINQKIYFFGEPCSVLYFDTVDSSTGYILNHKNLYMYRRFLSVCYDGNDNFYLLFVGAFFRFSITNNLMYFLPIPPVDVYSLPDKIISHYHQSSGTIFYLVGSDKNMTFCLRTEEWSRLTDDGDQVADRGGYGSCLIPIGWTIAE
ncbi:hypothetical protein SAMD00019534_108550 [Acytostelium subglobosum LB1]|uniref:hypothetical protein n=1 Tax=Acytostelium subglobosum LB1 TaxID=1410327 RepID=UPI000644CD81|nr:hypothetical protein SAMD00019534_108550 [Acytostelium subglobosum LB1]GAM27679.1 hypothetical protein SAMD00019534_108550 [Acytostelium subglobosum LB1]|eukprot:XP_012749338.1 hypothetical protein SAMD00019534_108550 [Acytostelium subglobosum LB1]